jgi:hypothetical protein
MARTIKITSLYLCGIVVLLAGCGGASLSAPARSSGTARVTGGTAITKAEFIKQADAICEKTDATQTAAVEAQLGSSNPNHHEVEQAIEKYALPPIKEEVDELEGLEVPAGDRVQIRAILRGIKGAVRRAEADPGSVVSGSGPFASVEKLGREFGFAACSTPA